MGLVRSTKDLLAASQELLKPNSGLLFTQACKQNSRANSGPAQADNGSPRAARSPLRPTECHLEQKEGLYQTYRRPSQGNSRTFQVIVGTSYTHGPFHQKRALSDRKRALSDRHRALSGGQKASWTRAKLYQAYIGPFKPKGSLFHLKGSFVGRKEPVFGLERPFSYQQRNILSQHKDLVAERGSFFT